LPSPGKNYNVPIDNHLVNNILDYREEIYSYGLHNPLPFNLDRATGTLCVADGGQNRREDINLVEKAETTIGICWNVN
jgi:glucose/arabinose dehydrogenase